MPNLQNNQSNEPNGNRILAEYNDAVNSAKDSSVQANKASRLVYDLERESNLIKTWTDAMAPEWVYIVSSIVAFIGVTVFEYFISVDIYRVFSKSNPIIVAMVFAAIAIFIAEFYGLMFSSGKKELAYRELRKDPVFKDLTDDNIRKRIARKKWWQFIFASIFAILTITAIYYLSLQRVEKLVNAGISASFGWLDGIPAFLYPIEIFSGIYIFSTIRFGLKKIKVWWLDNRFYNYVEKCSQFSIIAVEQMEQAMQKGYNIIERPGGVVDDLHEAFYRNQHLDRKGAEKLVLPIETVTKSISFKFIENETGNLINGNVYVITSSLFVSAAGTINGEAKFKFSAFEKDKVTKIIMDYNADIPGTDFEHAGAWEFGSEEPIIIRV